jgi:hypothetical protein
VRPTKAIVRDYLVIIPRIMVEADGRRYLCAKGIVMGKIKLADVIAELRRELSAANKAGQGEKLHLEVEAIDVELAVKIETSGEMSASTKLDIIVAEVQLKGDGKLSRTHSHTVKLRLKPSMNGKLIAVNDEDKSVND